MIFLPVQCRMARAALGWGVRDLASAAKVSADTVARFERGEELKERTVEALQGVLEAAGIEFTNGGQPGVKTLTIAGALDAVANSLMQGPAIFVWETPRPPQKERDRRQKRVEELAAEIKNIAQSAKHDASSLARYEDAVRALHALGTRADDNLDSAVHRAFVAAGI
jgi:transcriptional regulator with XRE-family HTH domain